MRVVTFDPPNDGNEIEISSMPAGVSLMLWNSAGDGFSLRLLAHEWDQLKAAVDGEVDRPNSHK